MLALSVIPRLKRPITLPLSGAMEAKDWFSIWVGAKFENSHEIGVEGQVGEDSNSYRRR
jgi:hypothetical protein